MAMKKILIDDEKVTMRRVAGFRKGMSAALQVEDEEERMTAQATVLASITENWTADDVLDLPVKYFNEFKDAITGAINGAVPKASATN